MVNGNVDNLKGCILMIDAIILAGGGKQSDLTRENNVDNKAFIEINGKPLVSYVLEALAFSGEVGRIAVVGPVERLAPLVEKYGVIAVPEAEDITGNIQAGFDALEPDGHFLVVTADIPLLTARAVQDTIALCRPFDADFYYPIVTKEASEARFPGIKRTYAALKDGVFTGGNLFVLSPAVLKKAMPKIRQIFALRKSPVKLAASLGPVFIVKLLARQLTIRELEKKVQALLGINGKAIITDYPEIGVDVDKPSDLAVARQVLAEHPGQ